ncbi:hypothetical protein MSG28_013171 [Choristoneura fumiferana]|uniref:Uncharacterized protein n=1 Tax=Choristoneura fumiferana TaxID=7141 RepID=A0ACC0KSU8_CHOFU|nr:hypothetical protein MSG28_013171 [Choristoneura fumiferana]
MLRSVPIVARIDLWNSTCGKLKKKNTTLGFLARQSTACFKSAILLNRHRNDRLVVVIQEEIQSFIVRRQHVAAPWSSTGTGGARAQHELFELLERVQCSRLDDQRAVLPPYFSQSLCLNLQKSS